MQTFAKSEKGLPRQTNSSFVLLGIIILLHATNCACACHTHYQIHTTYFDGEVSEVAGAITDGEETFESTDLLKRDWPWPAMIKKNNAIDMHIQTVHGNKDQLRYHVETVPENNDSHLLGVAFAAILGMGTD